MLLRMGLNVFCFRGIGAHCSEIVYTWQFNFTYSNIGPISYVVMGVGESYGRDRFPIV